MTLHESCNECKIYKNCKKPFIKGFGSLNPKLVLVLPYPEFEDDNEGPFTGKSFELVKLVLGENIEHTYITYLTKCTTYKNILSREEAKEPTEEQAKLCYDILEKEISIFKDATIMTFGNLALRVLTGDKQLKILSQIGNRRDVKIGNSTFKLIPNTDPRMVAVDPNSLSSFKNTLEKVFSEKNSQHLTLKLDQRYQLLNFDQGMQELDRCLELHKSGSISHIIFDYETSMAMEPWGGGEIIMVSFAHSEDSRGFSIPFYVTNEVHFPDLPYKIEEVPFDITEQQRLKLMAKTGEILRDIPISGHNLKYDMRWAAWKNVVNIREVKIRQDTYHTSVQVNSMGPFVDNSLKGLCRKLFDVPDDWEFEIQDYLKRFRLTKDRHYGKIPTSILGRYSALDSYYNKMLEEYFDETTTPEQRKMSAFVTAAIIPFVDSEIKGIPIDNDMFAFLEERYTSYLVEKRASIDELQVVKALTAKYLVPLEEENSKKKKPAPLDTLREKAFNLNNPKKVSELIFDNKFYRVPAKDIYKTDAGGLSTNKEARNDILGTTLSRANLEHLKNHKNHAVWTEAREFISYLGDYKRISKLLKDYIQSMPESMYQGVYKSQFNLNGTITGRLSSPFHSMPNRCDIKRLVCSKWASEGGLILAADESQLELRIVAALANEPKLIEAFKAGYDIHTYTGSQIYKVPVDKVTDVQRSHGKASNFAMLYGKTPENLAEDLNISVDEAKKMLSDFFNSLDKLTLWMDKVKAETKRTGYVDTILGRRIPIPQAFNKGQYDIAETERLAVNYRVQSPASDLVFDSVVRIWHRKEREKMRSDFLATVHDSIEYDVYPGEIFQLMKIFRDEAQDKIPELYPWVTCPLRLDFELGTSWGGAVKGELEHLDDKRLVFKAKGLAKDIKKLVKAAELAYNVKVEITGVDPIKKDSWKDDIFVRDVERHKATIEISQK